LGHILPTLHIAVLEETMIESMNMLGVRGVLCLAVALTACTGSSEGSDGGVSPDDDAGSVPTCGQPGRTGQTTCEASTAGTCPAGQYCDDVMLTCSTGCTSDDNCGANERCARAGGASVGACSPCPACGNGVCDPGETAASCPGDCAAGPRCGDSSCDAGETPASCPADCAAGPVCGDDFCEAPETLASCPVDCAADPVCGDGACEGGETPTSCPADCAPMPVCGDSVCDVGESFGSCPGDCRDLGLAECYETCDSYVFFECMVSAAACAAACDGASPPQRQRFLTCAEPVLCNDEGCLPRLE